MCLLLLVINVAQAQQNTENGQDTVISGMTRDLNEVVVTGALGIKRSARELGAAAQLVGNDELNQGKVVNPIFGLTSKVAGLRINMYDSKVDPQVKIVMRGSRSLNRAKNDPIYVVDGVPVPDISRLNPNDIESITVLKGANAAALYGSEGVNGALMITTKSGLKGRTVIRFSNTTTFSKAYLLPPAQTRYGQGTDSVYSPTMYESWGPAFDGSTHDVGGILPDGTQPTLRFAAPSKDNRLDLFQTGITQQNDLSFSGGDDKSTYFLSLQHASVKGIIPEDISRRTGARFNGSRRFGKLNTSYNFNYIHFKKDITPDGPWITAYQLPANFDYNTMKDWKNVNSAANPLYFFTDQQKNPYFQIDNIRDRMTQQTLNGKVELDYQVTDWFKAIYRLGMYSVSEETRATTGKFEAPGRRNVVGSVNDGARNFRRFNGDLILSFNKDFGKFSTRLLLGQNFRADYTKSNAVSAGNLTLPDLFNPGSRVGELGGSTTITEYRSVAGYGELTAGYDNFLFLTLTGRNDVVSVLSPENRSYFYPGVSASFVFHDVIEALKDSRTLTFGKIFASWNKTGNVTLDPYNLNNPYSQINGFPFGNLVGFTPGSKYPNPGIEPEFVTSYEAGTQLSFLDNRINFEFSYAFSDSKGQIFNANTSRATGYSTAVVNAGRLTNNVIELSLNADVIRDRSRDIRFNIGATFTHIKNEVKELYEELNQFPIFRQSYAVKHQAYPALLVSDYKRDAQGRVIVDAAGDPVVATNQTHLGTMVPPYQMGLSTMFSIKGFTINAQFDSRLGGWLYSEIAPRMFTAGTHPWTDDYDRQPFVFPNSVIEVSPGKFEENTSRLTSDGGKKFWSAQGAVQYNTAAKSDFFKLRELAVNYSLPASLLRKQNVLKDVNIGLVGTNLFIIRHKDNIYGDPEYLYNNTDGYISFRQVPPYRTYGFNINVTF